MTKWLQFLSINHNQQVKNQLSAKFEKMCPETQGHLNFIFFLSFKQLPREGSPVALLTISRPASEENGMRAYFKVIQVSLCLCWQCKKNSAIEGVTDHVMLTPIHDILRSQCKQHNVEEQHGQYQHQNQKQQSLRHSFARTDFIKLCFVSKGISMIITKTIQTFFWK